MASWDPDEFHEKYPGAAEGGLRNNAYTNVMVAWICETAQEVLDLLPASRREVCEHEPASTDEELARWREMSRKMFVPFHDDGIISQFEGYEELEELDWEDYRARYGNIQRLDRILRAEGDDPGPLQGQPSRPTRSCCSSCSPDEELRRTLHATRLRVRARDRSQERSTTTSAGPPTARR